MLNKNLVHSHFNRHSSTYDSYSNVQRKVVEKTLDYLSRSKYKRAFEFGSGTGGLTEKIVGVCENLECVDLSENMNNVSRKKILSPYVKWYENDIEQWRFVDKYDLIISSSTFQWIENKRDVLLRICNALNKNGEAIISFFDDRTFSDFRKIYSKIIGLDYVGKPELISTNNIEELLYNFPISCKVETEEILEPIDGLRSFFNSLKMIGANNPNPNKILTKNEWKQIFEFYDTHIVNDGKPFIRYGVTYLKVIK